MVLIDISYMSRQFLENGVYLSFVQQLDGYSDCAGHLEDRTAS